MIKKEIESILLEFEIPRANFTVLEIKSGLINDSYLVELLSESEQKYVLQRINTDIFPKVDELMNNVVNVSEHISNRLEPELDFGNYKNFKFITTKSNKSFTQDSSGDFWRLIEYLENTPLEAGNISEIIAAEAGKTLAVFHKLTCDINPNDIFEIIPGFHRVDLRFKNFLNISTNNNRRYEETKLLYQEILSFEYLVAKFIEIIDKGYLPLKISHNDPKVSNILFDSKGRAISMIDLDTVMPGYLNNDFGDAIRSLTNTSDENEKDLNRVDFDFSLFKSYTKAYLRIIKDNITSKEKEYLALFALLITFEQCIRFYGDYLQNDIYYKIDYATHNLQRAKVQFKLLKQMNKRFDDMQQYILTCNL